MLEIKNRRIIEVKNEVNEKNEEEMEFLKDMAKKYSRWKIRLDQKNLEKERECII